MKHQISLELLRFLLIFIGRKNYQTIGNVRKEDRKDSITATSLHAEYHADSQMARIFETM